MTDTTLHCRNWKVLETHADGIKTVCGVRRPESSLAKTPGKITCDRCSLRVLRTGQNIGLDIEKTGTWTWADLRADGSQGPCRICGDPYLSCEQPDSSCRHADAYRALAQMSDIVKAGDALMRHARMMLWSSTSDAAKQHLAVDLTAWVKSTEDYIR